MKHKTTGVKLGKNSVSGMMFVLRHKSHVTLAAHARCWQSWCD